MVKFVLLFTTYKTFFDRKSGQGRLKKAFQGETDFAGWERAAEREAGKSKKKGAGSGLAPRAVVLIWVLCQNTRNRPLCSTRSPPRACCRSCRSCSG